MIEACFKYFSLYIPENGITDILEEEEGGDSSDRSI